MGIYAAWAKVRTRQYFYASTSLAGQPFDYLANPVAILKGNLIIFAGFLLYVLGEAYDPVYSGIIVTLFYLVLPFLIYKSLRFYAHNSSFRNLRFRFLGTLGECYKTYLLFPVLIPFTLGIIVPYWAFRRKAYFFENFAFGRTASFFPGRPGYFYKIYCLTSLFFLAALVLAGIVVAVGVMLLRATSSSPDANLGSMIFFAPVVFPVLFLIFVAFAQQYLYARLTNYCWGETRLGQLQFQSTLSVRRLLWIRLTNIFAVLFSVGLLIPWAKVRRARYVLENLTVICHGSLDDFTAGTEADVGAFGEAATDFFDVEIGL